MRAISWLYALLVRSLLAAGLFTGAARAQGEGATKGSIEPGKLADFVVISRDIRNIPPAEIRGLQVLQTIVGGSVVYTAPASR